MDNINDLLDVFYYADENMQKRIQIIFYSIDLFDELIDAAYQEFDDYVESHNIEDVDPTYEILNIVIEQYTMSIEAEEERLVQLILVVSDAEIDKVYATLQEELSS